MFLRAYKLWYFKVGRLSPKFPVCRSTRLSSDTKINAWKETFVQHNDIELHGNDHDLLISIISYQINKCFDFGAWSGKFHFKFQWELDLETRP